MKDHLIELTTDALRSLVETGQIAIEIPKSIPMDRARDAAHGDFATAVCLGLAKQAKCKPRDLAEQVAARLAPSDFVERVEIAGPGFINFFLTDATTAAVVKQVLSADEAFGRGAPRAERPIQVEFVSANPTGPLHVGHGRGAAYGAALANLLEFAGHEVQREYYVNDAGRQMDILALSVWLRYLQQVEPEIGFPSNGYKGEYIIDFAATLRERFGDKFRHGAQAVYRGVGPDEPAGGDKEAHVDALIARMRELLGEPGFAAVHGLALDLQLADIREDLHEFGVDFDQWFSEDLLMSAGTVDSTIDGLEAAGFIYEQEGNRWFRSTDFGDEKDRVVVRANGASTYFASDIAYIANKVARGFGHIIYIWGADHHGYVARLKAAASALGIDPDHVEIQLVQFANLYRAGKKLPMSTRSGEFVTLRELREEVGRDAARFFYSMRRSDQHMDFDLDLAKKRGEENPVYYVQYAHARVHRILERAQRRPAGVAEAYTDDHAALLSDPAETAVMTTLSKFPEVVKRASNEREPHQIAFYLRELATAFHGFYNTRGLKVVADDLDLRTARLALCLAVAIVLRNGLAILGASAPKEM